MPGEPSVEWMPGKMPWLTWILLYGLLGVTMLTAFGLTWQRFPPFGRADSEAAVLLALELVAVFIAVAGAASYAAAYVVPRGGTVGLTREGLLVEVGTRRTGGVRLARRWENLEIRGRWVIVRPRPRWGPWFFYLNPEQAVRVREYLRHSVETVGPPRSGRGFPAP
jgi:hypothetical protein